MPEHASWSLRAGDEIVPGLVARRLLGGGNAYEAYLAFDETLYAPVVVKVVRPDQVDDEATLRGLHREVQALDRVQHPSIVRGFSAQFDGARPHVVLENIDGPRLSSLIRRHGPLPVQQLLPLALELASAAHYLRFRDVVHLDIKPSNVIMGAPARLIDLSVARSAEAAARLSSPIGTDDYMAPEQCDPPSTGVVGYAADIFGIGATLFHAAAGYQPFDDGDPDAPGLADRYPQVVAAPRDLPHFVAPEVGELILGCLQHDPEKRPLPEALAESVEPLMAVMPKGRLAGFKIATSYGS